MKDVLLYIVAESSENLDILKGFLPNAVRSKCGFVNAQAKSEGIADARTLLILERKPVALVVDADTTDFSEISDDEETLRDLLLSAAAGVKCEVFLAVPSLAAIKAKHESVSQIDLVKELVAFVDSVDAVAA